MKLKSLVFIASLSLFSSAFAARTIILDAPQSNSRSTANKAAMFDCQIRVINYSSPSRMYDLRMWGEVTNGAYLNPVYIYDRRIVHVIDLWDEDYGYCPSGMYLNIETTRGYPIYSNQFFPTGTLIKITSDYNIVKGEIQSK
ncbi:MAG: hypothetical protein H0U70_13250 [Tatlockia sp.]|nr:hypothetical protein [Tatlockia sp.]